MNQRLDKWRRWIVIIIEEVQNLVHFREVFLQTQKIIHDNEALHRPSSFYDFIKVGWVSYAAMAVRRQIKSKDGSISLAQLMEEIITEPVAVSFAAYEELYKDCPIPGLAKSDFRQFKSPLGEFVDVEMVKADLTLLKSSVLEIERFADKRLAHRDKGELGKVGTFDELHAAVETVHNLTLKYRLLLTGIGGDSLIPIHQFDWRAIFYVPWIKNSRQMDPPSDEDLKEWNEQ